MKKITELIRAKKYSSALEITLSYSDSELNKFKEKQSIESLLFNYFSYERKYSFELEKKLFLKFPNNFLKAIRTSQVFLKKDRFDLLSEINGIEVHKKIWKKLIQIDNQIWSNIQLELKKVLSIDIDQVLSEVIFWLEKERYDSDSKLKQHQLASIYSFFIKLYLHNVNQSINEESHFQESFFKSFTSKIKNKEQINSSISKIMNSIGNWISFNENLLQLYSFDLKIEPKEENGIIYFNQTPMNFYNWNIDGIRYEKNRIDYQQKSQKLTLNEIKKGNLIIPGETDETLELNIQSAIRLKKIELILKDLSLLDLDYFGEKKGLFKAFSAISGYSSNRFFRYELNLDEFKKDSDNWFKAYFKLFAHSIKTDTVIEPYLLIDSKGFVDIVTNVFSHFKKELISKIFNFISYTIDFKKDFNRFNVNYDVCNNPFIKIGELYFSPMLFFANNDWFYSATQISIKNVNYNKKQRKITATKMEQLLGDKFSDKGFKVKQITDAQANELDGDIDIIVEDNHTTLLIQLKRTYLRLNLKDAYYESMTSDKKASKQLNKVSDFLRHKNEIHTLKNNPTKWIVSTSYEYINTDINNSNKINYFDLLFALENDELNSLKAIINYLEKDFNLLSFYNVKKDDFETSTKFLNIIGLPLELVEPSKYLQPFFITDNYKKEYDMLYNKALSFYQKNDKEAIEILNRCLILNPNDIDVYGALGNCYANIKDLKNLKKYFEKALEIIPNEPYIKRNFALALIENEQYFKGIIMLQELYQNYNLIEDFSMIFIANYNTYKSKLTEKEDEIINSNWKNN